MKQYEEMESENQLPASPLPARQSGLKRIVGEENCVFIFGGQLIAKKIRNNQYVLNWIIGGIFTVTALIQLWRIFKKKGPAHQLEKHEEHLPAIEKKIIEKQL